MYEEVQAQVWDFTVPRYHNYWAAGAIHHNTGKTAANMADLALLVRGIHPHRPIPDGQKINVLVLAASRRQAAKVLGHKLFEGSEMPGALRNVPLIPPNEVDVTWLKVGLRVPYEAHTRFAHITFGWAGTDDEWKRFQGFNADAVYLDEDAGNAHLLRELFMRGLEHRKKGDAAPMAWAGGINWSATPTCGTEAFLSFRKYCQENNPTQSHFFIPPGQNPAITADALDEARKFLGAKHAQVRVDGTRDAMELLQIYGEQWNDARHMLARDYEIQPEDNLWLGYDPGVDHPTGMGLFAITAAEPITLNLVKYWNHTRQTLDYDVEQLNRYLAGRRLAGLVYDTAAKAVGKTGTSVISLITERLLAADMMPHVGLYQAHKRHWPGICAVRHYLDPDPLDQSVPALIRLSPSVESGGQLAREQMLKYRGKEATRFTGEGGVVKKDDEFPDLLRYLVLHRPAYNPAWRCGTRTRFAPAESAPMQPLPPPPSAVPSTPYERHLALSRNRRAVQAGRWTTSDF